MRLTGIKWSLLTFDKAVDILSLKLNFRYRGSRLNAPFRKRRDCSKRRLSTRDRKHDQHR